MTEPWAKRWSEGEIGFHEGKPNDLLVAHIESIEKDRPKARILVPLAGKAFDMRWLAERGHEVVGVELVWMAVTAFFDEWGVAVSPSTIGRKPAMSANGVTLLGGDIFTVTPDDIGRFDVIYDRAALVALDPPLRARYVDSCRALLAEGGITMLVTMAYDQSATNGPPWSVDEKTVRELYAPRPIVTLGSRAQTTSKRLTEAGIPTLEESLVRIG